MGRSRSETPTAGRSPRPDPTQARFFIALGAVGDLTRAAELAEVDVDRARAWVNGLDRPVWMLRRSEVARRLFQVANEALEEVRRLLRGQVDPETDPPAVSLRELVNVAERFFAAALKLDRDVGADGPTRFEFDLDGWTRDEDPVERATPTQGATDGDA